LDSNDFGPKGVNYKEQIQWRDADTGKLLAASDFFNPIANQPGGFLVGAGYGVLVYDGLQDGHITALKILRTSSAPSSSAPP
jgi:hypothetical protein